MHSATMPRNLQAFSVTVTRSGGVNDDPRAETYTVLAPDAATARQYGLASYRRQFALASSVALFALAGGAA